MGSNKFLQKFKKHQKYFYASLILIVFFFAGSALITPKITSVAENLLEDVIQENLNSKKNSIAFEFNNLNSFLVYSENLLNDSSKVPFQQLEEKLILIKDLALFSDLISDSFLYSITPNGIEKIGISPVQKESFHFEKDLLTRLDPLTSSKYLDTVITSGENVIYKKMYIKKRNEDTTLVAGYDIDLLAFWKYFSENNEARIGYTVVTDNRGVCLLHPEKEYIGQKLDNYFESIPIYNILNNQVSAPGSFQKDETTSEYLNLEVRRYFDKFTVGNTSLIIIESFPLDMILKEKTGQIHNYFLWISLLAFVIFMLLLLVSRYQLKKEFIENLKIVEEKEKLINANEKYQKENAVLQLTQLKKKINPHFLFNNLNSLHILIESKPELSQDFVLKLADVYRYLLENKEGNLITVKKEITFLQQYFFLQEIRFKNSMKVLITNDCEDKEGVLYKKIPFLALETLVENAIKHTEFTKRNPLYIEISIKEQHIDVVNNYAPRKIKNKDSHKIGLNYLENTYKYYNVTSFKAEISDGKFKCHLPLLG